MFCNLIEAFFSSLKLTKPTKFNDFKHIAGKREFLWANHFTKIFCFCVHSGEPDLI